MLKKSTWGVLAVVGMFFAVGYLVLERSTRPAPGQDVLPPLVKPSTPPSQPSFSDSEPVQAPARGATGGEAVASASDRQGAEATATPLFPPGQPLPSVDEILAADNDDLPFVARQLASLAATPSLPQEERENALAHALNLAAGQEPKIIDPLVANDQVPDEMAEIILAEALNRSLNEQADLYLNALAHRKSEAMQALIRGHLAFLTDSADLGPDPAAWRAAIEKAKQSWAE